MGDVDAVVMAAGEGRRLRPLTERWAKPILPIDGRPVIATLLRELAAAGFDVVTVVVGHFAAQVEALVRDGSPFGLRVRYAYQPTPLGSADAIRRALEMGVRPPLLVTAADTVFTTGDVGRAREEWTASGASGGLAVRALGPDELREQSLVTVQGERLLEIGGRPQMRGDRTLTAAPLWFLDAEVTELLEDLPGPPFEAAGAFTRAIEAGKAIAAIEVGRTRDITRPEDVVRRNFPYLWSAG